MSYLTFLPTTLATNRAFAKASFVIFLIVMTSVINVTVNFLYASENLEVSQAADNSRALNNVTLGYTGFDMVS